MSNYNDLVEFRNKLTNDTDYVIFEEDCQLLDRVLDELEQNAQLKSEQNKVAVEKLEEVKEFVRVHKEHQNYNCEELLQDITNLIKELKGESDE